MASSAPWRTPRPACWAEADCASAAEVQHLFRHFSDPPDARGGIPQSREPCKPDTKHMASRKAELRLRFIPLPVALAGVTNVQLL